MSDPARGITSSAPALPPEGAELDAIAHAIESVLATLPPRTRLIAARRLRDQTSTAVLARQFGLSEAAVERHLSRAAAALRAQLPRRMP
jgi:RNA polymerase sigma factor (sigma-70 family)